MPIGREVLAQMLRYPGDDANAVVMVPVTDPGPGAPAVLRDPLQSYPGVWRRESAPEVRPARYVHVESDEREPDIR